MTTAQSTTFSTIQLPFELPNVPGAALAPRWVGDGFVIGNDRTKVAAYGSMPSGWSDNLTQLHEEHAGSDHYIDVASRNHVRVELEKYIQANFPVERNPVILEVGCSSGFLLAELRHTFPEARLVGSDYVVEPLERLADSLSDVPLLQFDLSNCPLPTACVDVVVALNVLEHIQNDKSAAAHLCRILKPGGIAILEVPAGEHLFDLYDEKLCHHRRYSMRGLRALVEQAGFEIELASHLGFFLYPAFWSVKKRNRLFFRQATERQNQAFVNTLKSSQGASPLMHALMRAEATVRRHMYLPWGIRCLVTCRKPQH